MNDDKLSRNLKSVGMSCFVKYYSFSSSKNIDRTDMIERIKSENKYTEKSCISRVGHALSVISFGRGVDALNLVVSSNSSRISRETRELASHHISTFNV